MYAQGLHEGRPNYRTVQEKPPALNREHRALQSMKFFSFSLLWVIFALLGPDPSSQNQCDPGLNSHHRLF